MSGGHLAGTVGVDPGSLAAGTLDDLVGIGAVVRRVVSANVADRHVLEDLTPETLVRVAGAERKLTPEAMQANAIVSARHLVLDPANSTSMERRHQHRLVDFTTLDGLEQLTLEREETDALAAALEMLDPEDRALLVRHESDGVSNRGARQRRGGKQGRGRDASRSGHAAPRVRVGGPPVAGGERQQDQTAPSRGNVTRRSHNAAQISCRFDPHALEADVAQSRCGTVRRRRTWLLSLCSPHQLRTQPPPTEPVPPAGRLLWRRRHDVPGPRLIRRMRLLMLMSQRHDQPKDRSQRMAPCDDQETFEAGLWMRREGARAEKTAKL